MKIYKICIILLCRFIENRWIYANISGSNYWYIVGFCLFLSDNDEFCVDFNTRRYSFLFSWIGGRNTYGNSISVEDGIITIYNYKKNKLREFELNSMEKTYLQITFPWRPSPKYTSKKCLILYKNFEPYENMEYGSYWNDPNVIIIQNPLLIEKINSLFND